MKCCITICFFFCIAARILSANPFTGGKNKVAPIRREKPSDFIVKGQAQLHTKLGAAIYEWTQSNTTRAFFTIIYLSFFYGIMHALGPGHRKALVFSFYLTRHAPVWEPAVTSLALAALHSITSITLLLIFRGVRGALSARTDCAALYLEGFSLILLLVLSAASIVHMCAGVFSRMPLRSVFGRKTSPTQKGSMRTVISSSGAYGAARYKQYHTPHTAAYNIQWGTFLLSGLYPCPASLLVLVLVSSLDAFGIGIVAIAGISVGMTLPITAVAYTAWMGRVRLFQRISKTQKRVEIVAVVLALVAYSAIFILSLTAVLPFIKSLICA